MDPSYARTIGLDIDELLVSQPDYGEQALEIVDVLVRSGRPSLGAVAVVGGEDGQKLGRDRPRAVESLLVLVVGDRQVEGPKISISSSSLAALSAGRRSGTASSVATISSGWCPAGRLARRASRASATAHFRVLSSTIRSLAAATTGMRRAVMLLWRSV
jgi:hypothetical protein